jgi:extradiol dioxygenase family protein
MPCPFHISFPVADLTAARDFYLRCLGAQEGRATEDWVDFNLGGHQLSAHRVPPEAGGGLASSAGEVDGEAVPVRHFGLVLPWAEWEALVVRLRAAGVRFRREPGLRFVGGPGEQATFFVDDPSGNALEFKAFRDPASLFAR